MRRVRDHRLPAGRRGGIANLKLARDEEGALRYAGAVGTGFSVAVMRDLLKRHKPLAQKNSPVAGLKVKGAVWTRPELRAEVSSWLYDEWRVAGGLIQGAAGRALAASYGDGHQAHG